MWYASSRAALVVQRDAAKAGGGAGPQGRGEAATEEPSD
jgi:hypothetical protein